MFSEFASYLTDPLVLVGFGLVLLYGIHRTLIKSGILPPVSERTGGKIVQLLLRYGFFLALSVVVLGFARSTLGEGVTFARSDFQTLVGSCDALRGMMSRNASERIEDAVER